MNMPKAELDSATGLLFPAEKAGKPHSQVKFERSGLLPIRVRSF